ncbi:hypothetical protein R1sor_001420 [Riccia sorocarpa]|uniref:Uncharacterized protein n=1 Tax=Riccia sorocarpa TaxID=122646 RepID=A0ABD3GW82_9MARC
MASLVAERLSGSGTVDVWSLPKTFEFEFIDLVNSDHKHAHNATKIALSVLSFTKSSLVEGGKLFSQCNHCDLRRKGPGHVLIENEEDLDDTSICCIRCKIDDVVDVLMMLFEEECVFACVYVDVDVAVLVEARLGPKEVKQFESQSKGLQHCYHLYQHEKPSFREVLMHVAALKFLEDQLRITKGKIELYRGLIDRELIDSTKVTRAQVNCHSSQLLSRGYMQCFNDQLKSARILLMTERYVSEGFRSMVYENLEGCVMLGFITPFWNKVTNVTEVSVDSTFKTNQVRFKLFACNANVGGFGPCLSYIFYSRT